jgi:hypothetical protein
MIPGMVPQCFVSAMCIPSCSEFSLGPLVVIQRDAQPGCAGHSRGDLSRVALRLVKEEIELAGG